MLAISLVGGFFMVASGFCHRGLARDSPEIFARAEFTRVEQFSMQEFNRFSTASLITRCTNDLQQIQMTDGHGAADVTARSDHGYLGDLQSL